MDRSLRIPVQPAVDTRPTRRLEAVGEVRGLAATRVSTGIIDLLSRPWRLASLWQPLAAGLWWPVLAPRAATLAARCAPHVRGDALLDLGAYVGSGHLRCGLARHEYRVVLLDVRPQRGALGERILFQPIAAHRGPPGAGAEATTRCTTGGASPALIEHWTP